MEYTGNTKNASVAEVMISTLVINLEDGGGVLALFALLSSNCLSTATFLST